MNKKAIITILLAILTLGATAQNQNDTVVVVNEQKTMPSYPGGLNALMKFLGENIQYPELAEQYGVEAKITMDFIVDKNGKLKDISANDCKIERLNTTTFGQETKAKQAELKKQFALLFAKEGARVIRKMPKWKPGKVNGQNVETKFHLPIHFTIPDK